VSATYLNEAAFVAEIGVARGGIAIPRDYDVPFGHVVYRFFDRRRCPSDKAATMGGWWLEFEHYRSIEAFARRHGHSMNYAARLFLAIRHEWSEVDAVVRCRVRAPLRAWKGRGRVIESEVTDVRDQRRTVPVQGVLEVYQVYIPGLAWNGPLASSAFDVLGSERIT